MTAQLHHLILIDDEVLLSRLYRSQRSIAADLIEHLTTDFNYNHEVMEMINHAMQSYDNAVHQNDHPPEAEDYLPSLFTALHAMGYIIHHTRADLPAEDPDEPAEHH